jgi:hypothetical protein
MTKEPLFLDCSGSTQNRSIAELSLPFVSTIEQAQAERGALRAIKDWRRAIDGKSASLAQHHGKAAWGAIAERGWSRAFWAMAALHAELAEDARRGLMSRLQEPKKGQSSPIVALRPEVLNQALMIAAAAASASLCHEAIEKGAKSVADVGGDKPDPLARLLTESWQAESLRHPVARVAACAAVLASAADASWRSYGWQHGNCSHLGLALITEAPLAVFKAIAEANPETLAQQAWQGPDAALFGAAAERGRKDVVRWLAESMEPAALLAALREEIANPSPAPGNWKDGPSREWLGPWAAEIEATQIRSALGQENGAQVQAAGARRAPKAL